MGEYTGRRRGRAASEPSAQEPGYPYEEESAYQQGYFADDHAQPQPGYDTQQQYGYEYAPEYSPDPAYGYREAPSYEQQPGYEQYEQYPSYEQQPGYEQHPSYEQQPSYEQYPGYEQPAAYSGEPSYESGYESGQHYGYGATEPYPQQDYYPQDSYQEAYQEPYQEPYQEYYQQESYPQEQYQEGQYQEAYQEPYYEQPYEEQLPEPRRRTRSGAAEEPYAEAYAEPYAEPYASYDDNSYNAQESYDSYAPEPELRRAPLPLLSHLPYTAAATAALAIASFVSAKAVAAVVLPLQLVVAWAILSLAGYASRRTAVIAALPTLAGTVATFKFQPDDAVIPVAAGLGAGFVLIAADAVFRARRRGVEPGSVRALAAAASALLFAGLTGLFLPASALDSSSVAIGAAVCGLASVTAARNPELGASRTAVVAIPVTIAALASYAAAILVP